MNKFLTLSFLIMMLSGCASTPYGNYIDLPTSYEYRMADDTVYQLTNLYSPGATQFNLQQKTNDAFGQKLVTDLRARGYAIAEYTQNNSKKNKTLSNEKSLGYIVDQQIENLYRVTIVVDNESISRAYIVENKIIYPAGNWAYKGK